MNKDWKVFWYPVKEGKVRRIFKITHSLPEASELRKKLRAEGYEGEINFVSRAKPYGPVNAKAPKQNQKHLWCPYCVNWRMFEMRTIRTKEFPTPDEDIVCEVCLIPIRNYYVQKYNNLFVHVDMAALRKAVGAW